MPYVIESSPDGWGRFIPKRSTSIIQIPDSLQGVQRQRMIAHEIWHYKQWQWAWDKAKEKKPSGLFSCFQKYNRYNVARDIFDDKPKELAAQAEGLREIKRVSGKEGADWSYYFDKCIKALKEDEPYKYYRQFSETELKAKLMQAYKDERLYDD